LSDVEGTIQFAYNLTPSDAPILGESAFAELRAWRSILFTLDLLGQRSDKYGGYAYGNLSVAQPSGFAITASQTSGAPKLLASHIVAIKEANLQRFWIEAEGSEPPSSESITHAMIYQADARVRVVFHIHSAEIWQARADLKLPETPESVPYGSPEMAQAVSHLLAQNQSRPLVFATAGHEDGVFALGHHARDCGGLLVTYLAKARALA
jgi:hypothetical protein